MKTCPSADLLTAYLRDDLDAPQCEAIEIHSENCSTCQTRLAGLVTQNSAGPTSVDRSPTNADTPPINSALSKTDSPKPDAANESGTDIDWPLIPGFKVVRILGRGGMSVVYEAIELDLNRRVAVKMLHAEVCEAETLARFQREAETVAKLKHPNLVSIYAVGALEGRPFIALELVDGGNLAERLREAPMTPADAAALLEQVARGVHEAHRSGVIHRDLKPANILLQLNDPALADRHSWSSFTPKVTDFGLARNIGAAQDLTQTGVLMGTPNYMAPEQTKEKGTDVGPATDVHALGTILYEMITGRPPFLGAGTVDTMLTLVNTEAVPPRRLNPALPRDLETICLKCLEKDPARRYADAGALAEDLQRFRVGRPITARPVGPVEILQRWCYRNPLIASLVFSLFVVLTAGIAGLTWKWREAEHEADLKQGALINARDEASLKDLALRKAIKEQYHNAIALAHREWLANNVKRAEDILNSCPEEHKAWEWHYLKRLCHTEHASFPARSFARSGTSLAYSSDARWIAAGDAGAVRIHDAETGKPVRSFVALPGAATIFKLVYDTSGRWLAAVVSDQNGVPFVKTWDANDDKELLSVRLGTKVPFGRFSADGRFFAWRNDKLRVEVLDLAKGQVASVLQGQTSGVHTFAFSPDGEWLATGSPNQIGIWKTSTGELVHTPKHNSYADMCLAFSADNKQLFVTLGDKSWSAWEVASGRLLRRFLFEGPRKVQIAVSPDGRHCLMQQNEGELALWDLRNWQQIDLLHESSGSTIAFAFSPDGKKLATRNVDDTVRLWTVPWPGQSKTWSLAGTQKLKPQFSRGFQRYLKSIDKTTIKVYDAVNDQELHTFTAPAEIPQRRVLSSGGRYVAFAYASGQVRVWDLHTAREQILEAGKSRASKNPRGDPAIRLPMVVFSPDQTRLAICLSDAKIQLWDIGTGQVRTHLIGHDKLISDCAFFADGRQIVTAGLDSTIRFWDAETGAEVGRILTEKPIARMTLSRDNEVMATAAMFEGTVQLWDVKKRQKTHLLRVHHNTVRFMCFGEDGRRLATTAKDMLVLWDTETGRELLLLKNPQSDFFEVHYDAATYRFITSSLAGIHEAWEGAPMPSAKTHRKNGGE